MLFIMQTLAKPNILVLVRATSRIDAIRVAELIDVPKTIWLLENANTKEMTETILHLDIG